LFYLVGWLKVSEDRGGTRESS